MDQAKLPMRAGPVLDAGLIVRHLPAPYEHYRPGGPTKEGKIIKLIEHRGDQYIIFRCDGESDFRFEFQPSEWLTSIAASVGHYRGEAAVQLLGAYSWRFSKMLCECARSAIDAGLDSKTNHFAPVARFLEDWAPVGTIFGTGPGFIVYQDKKGELSWETPESETTSAYKAKVKLIEAMAGNLPSENRERLTALLGGALTSALRTSDKEEGLRFFVPAREYVANVSDALARSKYLSFSAVSGLVLVAAVCTLYWRNAELIPQYAVIGLVGGVVGALISVAQRNNSILLNTIVPYRYLAVQGVVRVALGAVFGILAVMICKSNLAFGMFAKEVDALFMLSVIGGISERLVPDVLSRLAATASSGKSGGAEIPDQKPAADPQPAAAAAPAKAPRNKRGKG